MEWRVHPSLSLNPNPNLKQGMEAQVLARDLEKVGVMGVVGKSGVVDRDVGLGDGRWWWWVEG